MDNHIGFEILEHTADVGVRAWGDSLEEAFRQTTLGLLDIVGAWRPDGGERHRIEVQADDLGGLLVDWLGEVLYLQDTADIVISGIGLTEVDEHHASGWVDVAARPEEIEGTAVKAITYHQLQVENADGKWVTTVYLDI